MIEDKAEKILKRLSARGMKPGLERMTKLMHALGDPQEKFRSIHVTGTNGKGSVCAMLESILHSARYRLGLYTSPHLTDVCERIRLNKENISSSEFYGLVNEVWSCAKSIQIDDELTYFEMLTSVAFCYFAKSRVELAVIEVGLGGRLDATNVIPSPEVCVITNISLEHTEILGKSIEKIAREKAGIVKKNSTCVTAAGGMALKVLKEICLERKAWLNSVQAKDVLPIFMEQCALKGEYQKANLAVVLEVIEILRKKGWEITQGELLSGLQEIFLKGRFQEMSFLKPGERSATPVFLDGAHNPAAIRALSSAICSSVFKNKPCILIFNALKEKDIVKMTQVLTKELNLSQLFIPVLDTERSSQPEEVAKLFHRAKAKCPIQTFLSVKECWEFICRKREWVPPADWILVTGSLYLVGETLKTGFLKPAVPVLLKEYA